MNELKRESQRERFNNNTPYRSSIIIRRVVYRRERFKSHRVVRSTFSFFFSFGFLDSKAPKKKKEQDQEKDGPEESALK